LCLAVPGSVARVGRSPTSAPVSRPLATVSMRVASEDVECRVRCQIAPVPRVHVECEIGSGQPDNAGIRVSLTVNRPGRFTVFQNVRVEAGGKILFQYSECWSMSSSKSQWDYFCVPVHLRGTRYKSVTQIWIERQLPDRRTSRSSGRGERGCAFRSAASAAESA
jgi:hypothetical protein